MTFGERIRNLREDLDLKQNEVANQLNILPKSLSNYELDIYEPSFSILNQLANFYNVSVDYLLGNTDIKSRWKDIDKAIQVGNRSISGIQIIDELNQLDEEEKEHFIGLLKCLIEKSKA